MANFQTSEHNKTGKQRGREFAELLQTLGGCYELLQELTVGRHGPSSYAGRAAWTQQL
jgi:hypothetical protein